MKNTLFLLLSSYLLWGVGGEISAESEELPFTRPPLIRSARFAPSIVNNSLYVSSITSDHGMLESTLVGEVAVTNLPFSGITSISILEQNNNITARTLYLDHGPCTYAPTSRDYLECRYLYLVILYTDAMGVDTRNMQIGVRTASGHLLTAPAVLVDGGS